MTLRGPGVPARSGFLAAAILAVLGAGGNADHPKPAVRLDPPSPASRAGDPRSLHTGEKVVAGKAGDLALEIRVRAGDTWGAIGERYLTDMREVPRLKSIHGESLPAPGNTLRIPYASLNDDFKLRVVRLLFPSDRAGEGRWVHRVGGSILPGVEDSLWNLALWLTGRGENFAALAEANRLPGLIPARGQEITVPGHMLLPPFARVAGAAPGTAAAADQEATEDDFTEATPGPPIQGPPAPPLPPLPLPPAEGADELRYGRDSKGDYAAYKLRRGEALYSAVVVRYTGRIDAQEVNDLALRIARRSAIRDVTDIPIGYRVKIPLDLLLPEYLPPGDPRRQAWERSRAEVARYTNVASSRNLAGVAVILDAGHGGRDRGAAHNGLWEHDYVYDVLCRIKARLESETGARVLPTIRDRKEGYRIRDSARLPRSRAEILLTDPPFPLDGRVSSVNLRWYLANSLFRRLLSEGYDPDRIVFTSLHADARHPSLGGAMIYVPGEEFRRGRYGHHGAAYARYREVREQPYVSFPEASRERSEGLSRQLAGNLITAFRGRGVAVHPYAPVRERIIRRGRSWVPAVLRCNQIPAEVLIEVSNLNNAADARLLADPSYRQKVADAYVVALHLYYGGPPRTIPATAASVGRR